MLPGGVAAIYGNAVFLCVAGVSFRVGLPSFELLTKQVYQRLGEASDDEPAERDAVASKQFDRKRLSDRTALTR